MYKVITEFKGVLMSPKSLPYSPPSPGSSVQFTSKRLINNFLGEKIVSTFRRFNLLEEGFGGIISEVFGVFLLEGEREERNRIVSQVRVTGRVSRAIDRPRLAQTGGAGREV